MSKYHIYLISDNGKGIPERLEDWDGEEQREFHLSAYANNAVISIEPAPHIEKEEK